MEKKIVEYVADEKRIELYASFDTTEELQKVREELEGIEEVVFKFIDGMCLRGYIENATYETVKKLEKLGWSF